MAFDHFGRYIIKCEIGRGGMATVFHALDPRFERDVAIKVLPREFLHDPQFRVRFDREAKMVALLEHHAIVPVYDFGEEEGQPYIVMRYLSGGSLSERIKQGPISLDEAVKTVTRLAQALDAAHAKGIVHRDLKPANVLFDQYGNAFLSDFGIARLMQSTSVTLTGGAVLGTPAYMSPEQVQGGELIDGRSDIYSLGVIIYQMLIGKTPYRADTSARLMMMHILEPVPHILDENTELPAELDEVIATAMAKSPDERYQTALALADALRSAVINDIETTYIQKKPPTEPSPIPHRAPGAVSKPRIPVTAARESTPRSHTPQAYPPTPVLSAETVPAPTAKRNSRLFLTIAGIIVVLVIAVVGVSGGMMLFSANRQKEGQATFTPTFEDGLIMAAAAPSQTLAQSKAFAPTVEPSLTPEPSPLPTNTPAPTATDTPPPPTPLPSETLPPAAPVLGGADMLAFVRESDIWTIRLDGSGLTQMTTDGGTKAELQWTPDGQALVYISGLCVKMITLANGQINDVVCFEYAGTTIEEFEISPDGSRAAISVNQELFLIPFDLAQLEQVDRPSKVKAIADCESMAPYSSNTGSAFAVFAARWSQDMQQMAVLMKIIYGQQQEDAVVLIDITNCGSRPANLDAFPSTRFRIGAVTRLENVGWDGFFNFALIKIERNEGFGSLYFYNADLHRPDASTNPIDGVCCYRDPSYSPDGSYLAFAFQDIRPAPNSKTELYYVPVGTLFTGLIYTPIPLPDGFFTDLKESPQPVARPATILP